METKTDDAKQPMTQNSRNKDEIELLIDRLEIAIIDLREYEDMEGSLSSRNAGEIATMIENLINHFKRDEEHNPNMEGAKEFIHALILNQPIWPNLYGQDVAAAAFFIHEERLKAQREINRLREEIKKAIPMRCPRMDEEE